MNPPLPSPPETTEQLDEFMTDPAERVRCAVEECAGEFVVLGAGGKMGFHLCWTLQRALQQLGRTDPVIAVSRFSSQQSRDSFQSHGVKTIAADLSDALQLALIPKAANVFYLAGVKFGTADDASLLHQMNVTMPEMVAEHFSVSRIVALSTGCVYSFVTPQSGGSTENDACDPPGEYARSCQDRERAFVEGSRRHGTRCALVRLNYSIDLRYGVLVDIAQQILAGQPIDVTTGHVNVIWQGDAISHIIQCLPKATSPPLILNVTGSDVIAVREIAQQFAKRLGRDVQFQGEEAATCWLSNSRQACRMFGPPRVTVDQMIDWISTWLLKGGVTLGKPTQFQIRDGSY